ncbi:hypothetical protein [Endozoicomonas atrinae]|uniref:hypothetical protein n=1 Tax=Endozoicomonas atrinae TaxID=1333660 RepID=UPI0008271FD5|nr:hypothetical protein [Endozoicomonas atrinae]
MESLQRSSSTGELGSLSAKNVELDLNDFPLLPAGKKVVLAGGRGINTVNPTLTLSEHSDNIVGSWPDMKLSFASMVSGASVVKAIEPEVTEGLTQNVPETSKEESVPLTEAEYSSKPGEASNVVSNGAGEKAKHDQSCKNVLIKPVATVRPLPSDILLKDEQFKAGVTILQRPAAFVEHHKKWAWEKSTSTELWSVKAERLYNQAAKKRAEKQYQDATALYEKVIKRFPQTVYAVVSKLALAERFTAIPEFSSLKSEARDMYYLCCNYCDDFNTAIESKQRLNTEAGDLDRLDLRSEACFDKYFYKLETLMDDQKKVIDELRAFCSFLNQPEKEMAEARPKYLALMDDLKVHLEMMDDEIMDVLGVSYNLKSSQDTLKDIFHLREDWRAGVKKTDTEDVEDTRQTLPKGTNEYLRRIEDRLKRLEQFQERHVDAKFLYQRLTEV